MHTAVCPGSFDPVTYGHLDIVGRAARLFDQVTVAVLVNPTKNGMFSVDERVDMMREVVSQHPTVTVEKFDGLLVDFCAARGITAIVKGLRAVMDFDFELQMAQMNSRLTGVETVFVPTTPEWSYLASSLVKEVASHGGDVAGLLPPTVLARLLARIQDDGGPSGSAAQTG